MLHALGSVAQRVLAKLPEGKDTAVVIALSGNLGAGKTTFVQALGTALAIPDTIQSPTYVLMKVYDISYKQFTKLVHIDAYRLNNAAEFAALKPETFLSDPQTIVCIEWPERVEGALPKPDIQIRFSSDPPQGEAGGATEEERYIEVV